MIGQLRNSAEHTLQTAGYSLRWSLLLPFPSLPCSPPRRAPLPPPYRRPPLNIPPPILTPHVGIRPFPHPRASDPPCGRDVTPIPPPAMVLPLPAPVQPRQHVRRLPPARRLRQPARSAQLIVPPDPWSLPPLEVWAARIDRTVQLVTPGCRRGERRCERQLVGAVGRPAQGTRGRAGHRPGRQARARTGPGGEHGPVERLAQDEKHHDEGDGSVGKHNNVEVSERVCGPGPSQFGLAHGEAKGGW